MMTISCHRTHHRNANYGGECVSQEASAAQTITMLKDEMDELTALVEAGPAAEEEAMLAGLLKEKDTLLRERDTQVPVPSALARSPRLEQRNHVRCSLCAALHHLAPLSQTPAAWTGSPAQL